MVLRILWVTLYAALVGVALLMVMLAAPAFAQGDPSAAGNGLELRLWSLLAGALVPLGGYLLNYLAPWVSEPVKALVQVALAAAAGAVVELVDLGSVGFDLVTLEYVLTAVVAALAAHAGLWRPGGISTAFGGGRDRQAELR